MLALFTLCAPSPLRTVERAIKRVVLAGVAAAGSTVAQATAPSPFYEMSMVARPGASPDFGGAIASIEPAVTINEKAECAFVANLADGSEQLLAWRQPARLLNLSRSPAGRNFDFPRINNQGRVVTRELLSGNSLIRLWNSANTGDSQIVASSTLSLFSQVTLPTLGNTNAAGLQPLVSFLGRLNFEDTDLLPFTLYANDTGRRNEQETVSNLSGTRLTHFRAQSADTHRRRLVLQFSTPEDADRLVVCEDPADDGLWDNHLVASTRNSAAWSSLGKSPAMSGTGQLVVFGGEGGDEEHPAGVYLAFTEGSFADFEIEPVITLETTVAYNDDATPITFDTIDFDTPLAVEHVEAGAPGLEGDWAVVTFVGTPAREAWPTANPHRLRLFSAKPGLWSIRIDFERHLVSADPPLLPPQLTVHATPPRRIVQEGDVLRIAPNETFVVSSFAVHDPLAIAAYDGGGRPRRTARGDHHVAFAASNGSQTMVFRGSHLDSDEDGLLDHWEARNKGIDADGDGFIDLSLSILGADVMRKDSFIEIDWTRPRTTGSVVPWSNEPAPGAIEKAVSVFAAAPVANPDGTTGVTLHVDAGPGSDAITLPLSMNLPRSSTSLGGGELIGMPGDPSTRPDIVYFDTPGSVVMAGSKIRSLTDTKREFFENRDKGARELAFRYVVMADFFNPVMSAAARQALSAPVTAATANTLRLSANLGAANEMAYNAVLVTQGRGAGQVRMIATNTADSLTVTQPFAVVPDTTSRISVATSNGGVAEVYFREFPDHHGHPGNDLMVTLGEWGVNEGGWLGNADIQWRTLVHELGHTLGLRHGGIDHEAYKGDDYKSLMSYSWQLESASVVQSFADSADITFDDWGYLRHDFSNSAYLLGNAFGLNPKGVRLFTDFDEPTYADYLQVNGQPPDLSPPAVTLLAPTPGTQVGTGALTATVQAVDNVAVREVLVRFDADGSGEWEAGRGEVVTAVPGAGGRFTGHFPMVTGPAGARRVLAVAVDSSDNRRAADTTVLAGSGAGSGSVIRQANGTFPAQPAGAAPQSATIGPITLPSSGVLSVTVTADPTIRQTGTGGGSGIDPGAWTLHFAGESIALNPVFTPDGRNPSVATTTWFAPAAGSLSVDVRGPAILDPTGATLAHPAQNYQVSVVFHGVDRTAPGVTLVSPGAGGFAEAGRPLVVEAEATDDFGVASVRVQADLNGDGDTADAGESATANPFGGSMYQAGFSPLTGPPGARIVNLRAVDTSGQVGDQTTSVEVRERDVTPPAVSITSPPPGWPLKAGDILNVSLTAVDAIELTSLQVEVDLNGDGSVTGATESVGAVKSGVNQFAVQFPAISGPNGPRTVRARAVDSSGNSSTSETIVTVGGVTPVTATIFTEANHAIPAQGFTGSQLVFPYTPLAVPGAGTLTFTITATPPVRLANQNIPRADPYVRDITVNGTPARLNPTCNAFGSDPAVCSTSHTLTGPATVGFSVLGPGVWNTFSEFVGHAAQTYSLKVDFTAVDTTLPSITFVTPSRGGAAVLGSPMTVALDVTDNRELASVVALFDINGDGDSDDLGERAVATRQDGARHLATFAALSGVPGPRPLLIIATDTSFNTRRASITLGTDGTGGGETVLLSRTGIIPAQPIDIQGGRRQTISVPGITVPGVGRLVMRVDGTPPVRQPVANLERHDATVRAIRWNGQTVSLTPECNEAGANPTICVSTWDSPGSGTLDVDILGPAQYNIWGEFIGHPEIAYSLEVTFLPGPTVASVLPSTGSIAGGQAVVVRGSGFAPNAVVLFDGIPAAGVTRVSSTELTVATPPGIAGDCDVRVINPDPDGLPWNYGVPYGLFGTRAAAFTYQPAASPGALDAERLLGTWAGSFAAVGEEEAQRQSTQPITVPGAGRLRFTSRAFIPILNPIAGPFENPSNFEWNNESTAVRRVVGANAAIIWPTVVSSDLSFPFGAVITESVHRVDAAAAGAGNFTVFGPARWNAFWRDFGEFIMVSAPAQDWITSAWFAHQPTLTSLQPSSGTGGTLLTLRGTHFASGQSVTVGGLPATSITLVSPTEMTCRAPFTNAGRLDVAVTVLDMTATLAAAFTHDGKGGPAEDADGDGLATLVEQFMGLNPAASDARGAIAVIEQSGALVLKYRRARNTGGAVGTAEYSSDLVGWQSTGVTEVVVRDVAGESYVEVAALIPGSSAGRFARLRVRQ